MRPFQTWCSVPCGSVLAEQKLAKKKRADAKVERVKTKEKLDKLKGRSKWAKEAQAAVNKFIRLRDADQPCISCGRYHQGSYDAGHYLSVGARPELRFDELNIHKQCVPCNQHLSGNVVNFRKGLLIRIGAESVAYLEGPHEPKKYTIDELKAIIRAAQTAPPVSIVLSARAARGAQ